MLFTKPTLEELLMLRSIANYQFGYKVGPYLVPDNVIVGKSPNTLRIRYIYDERRRPIATLKPSDYLYTLHILGGMILHRVLSYPKLRIVVHNNVAKFIRDGYNVFSKHIVDFDEKLRAGREVLIVDQDDNLLAVGKLKLSPVEIASVKRGEAVRVRHTIEDIEVQRYG